MRQFICSDPLQRVYISFSLTFDFDICFPFNILSIHTEADFDICKYRYFTSADTLKISIDAGFMQDGNTWWGMIVRDYAGSVIYAATESEAVQISPIFVEALECAGLCCGFKTKIKGRQTLRWMLVVTSLHI
ncbi:hypothetical protein A2U01_0038442 [Trifolium medium]|uniref:Uncharacterized protein n=1 Tax=Trifolium medium TaxID=97028 RepID=A0A392Q224_9FABA|nr:hypothetical protein [Trifolium medium]